MFFTALRDQRNDSRHTQLRQLFYRPFHSLKTNDAQSHNQGKRFCRLHFFVQRKLDSIGRYFFDDPSPNLMSSDDIEFLADLCAQDTRQMRCLLLHAAWRNFQSIDLQSSVGESCLLR